MLDESAFQPNTVPFLPKTHVRFRQRFSTALSLHGKVSRLTCISPISTAGHHVTALAASHGLLLLVNIKRLSATSACNCRQTSGVRGE